MVILSKKQLALFKAVATIIDDFDEITYEWIINNTPLKPMATSATLWDFIEAVENANKQEDHVRH